MIRPVHPAGLTDTIVSQIEGSILDKAKAVMTARRFLDFEGPLGGGIESLQVGPVHHAEIDGTGARVSARRAIPIPTLYSTFELPRREIEGALLCGKKQGDSSGNSDSEEEEGMVVQEGDRLRIQGTLEDLALDINGNVIPLPPIF